MRIAVCDDEPKYCQQVKMKIEHVFHRLDLLVDTFLHGKDLLKRFQSQRYDVIFLDIEMPELDGISLAKKLREESEDVILVFLTGHIEYALEGYEVNALRYLTKPVREDKLREVLRYVMEQEKRRRSLWLKTDWGEERVAVSDMIYLEAQNQNILVCTRDKKYVVRYNMGDFEDELRQDGFFRIHRGYLVSLDKIKGFHKREVLLEGDVRLPVSRTRERALREALYQYIKEEAF